MLIFLLLHRVVFWITYATRQVLLCLICLTWSSTRQTDCSINPIKTGFITYVVFERENIFSDFISSLSLTSTHTTLSEVLYLLEFTHSQYKHSNTRLLNSHFALEHRYTPFYRVRMMVVFKQFERQFLDMCTVTCRLIERVCRVERSSSPRH